MRNMKTRRLQWWVGLLSGGLVFQSGCPLADDFDPITLFAQTAATLIADSVFFALDSFLIRVS